MMVAVDRIPIPCASRITRSQVAVSHFLGQITCRTSSTRISAAVPWRVPRPAARSRSSTSRVETPAFSATNETSSGEQKWTSTPGAASRIHETRSVYDSTEKPGWTPESGQISVTPRSAPSRARRWISSFPWRYVPGAPGGRPKPQKPQRFLQMFVTCRFWFLT